MTDQEFNELLEKIENDSRLKGDLDQPLASTHATAKTPEAVGESLMPPVTPADFFQI